MPTIAIMNQKGGVGKTTTTLNLGAAIHRGGGHAVMIDLDPQAHLTSVHPEPNKSSDNTIYGFYQNSIPLEQMAIDWVGVGKLVCSNRELIRVETSFGKGPSILNRLRIGIGEFEKISLQSATLIDCSPHLGVLTLSAIFAADLVIVPISSDFLSINGAKKIAQTLNSLETVLKKRVNRRYLLTKYDRRRLMSSQVLDIAKTYFGEDVLDVVIAENVELAKSINEHKDIFSYNIKCLGAHNYADLYEVLRSQQFI